MRSKKHILIFVVATFIIGFVCFFTIEKIRQDNINKQAIKSSDTFLITLKEKDLKDYNGENPNKPIYIGLDGYVYDVTSGREFYKPGGAYHDLAGRDSTDSLKIFGGDIIKRKYPIVAKLVK